MSQAYYQRRRRRAQSRSTLSSNAVIGRDPNTAINTPYTMTARGSLVAPRLRCRLRYSTNLAIVTGVLGTATNIFNLNSLYDPDRTGVGHQPRGFDQIKTLYNRYRVYGCAYKVSAQLRGSNDSMALIS